MGTRAGDVKALTKELKRKGWNVTDTGKKNLRLTHPNGGTITASKTSSDRNAIKQIERDIKRAEQRNQSVTTSPQSQAKNDQVESNAATASASMKEGGIYTINGTKATYVGHDYDYDNNQFCHIFDLMDTSQLKEGEKPTLTILESNLSKHDIAPILEQSAPPESIMPEAPPRQADTSVTEPVAAAETPAAPMPPPVVNNPTPPEPSADHDFDEESETQAQLVVARRRHSHANQNLPFDITKDGFVVRVMDSLGEDYLNKETLRQLLNDAHGRIKTDNVHNLLHLVRRDANNQSFSSSKFVSFWSGKRKYEPDEAKSAHEALVHTAASLKLLLVPDTQGQRVDLARKKAGYVNKLFLELAGLSRQEVESAMKELSAAPLSSTKESTPVAAVVATEHTVPTALNPSQAAPAAAPAPSFTLGGKGDLQTVFSDEVNRVQPYSVEKNVLEFARDHVPSSLALRTVSALSLRKKRSSMSELAAETGDDEFVLQAVFDRAVQSIRTEANKAGLSHIANYDFVGGPQ